MRINLLFKITIVALVLLGLSLRSAVSAGGSDEEVFPPKTLEKLKKIIPLRKRKQKLISRRRTAEQLKNQQRKKPKRQPLQRKKILALVQTKMFPIEEIVLLMFWRTNH